jgi:hypothetical protein
VLRQQGIERVLAKLNTDSIIVVWAFIAGWSSGLSVGSINCGLMAYATNDGHDFHEAFLTLD